ncbi:MAG: sulfatase [Desulfobacterales bacterium]|nr:sulfatase [Desulfobacterales bacterium]
MAFDEIRLKTPSIPDHSAILQKNEDQILQSPHTVMNYYYRVPAGSNLEVAAAPLKNPVTGKILISSGDKETKRIDLAVKKNDSASKKISLEPFAGQIVKFSFCIADDASQPQTPTESTLKNGVLWSKLKIDKAENDLDEQTPTKTAPLNKFKKSIRNLDVIYIVFDAFNAKHSNIYGYNRDTTPFLAQLSKRGIVFDHFFANQPYTLASTATLLTSTYCDEHGLIRHQNRLSPVVQTLPEILSDHDVASYLITGHTYFKETWGLQRGFTDVFFDLKYNNQANEIRNALETIYQSANDQTAQKFIYLHLMPPHAPYEPPEKYQTFHQENHTPISVSSETLQKIQDKEIEASQSQLEHIKAMYDANILFADAIAQKIVDFLESRQLKEKTIIFFTSDHGEAFMEHGFTTHNDSIYDDMLHIPFIISTPEKIQTERKNIPNIASIVDIKPTLLDIFNIRATDRLKGTSLLPTLFEESAKGHMDHIYLETLARTGQIGIRDLNYKLIIAPDGNELFDLQKDPAEQNNCFNERPLIAGYYLQKLKRYQDQNERAGTGGDVNIENLDEKTLNQLKELGYIK